MSRHAEFKKAFILHMRPYRETSVLLDFFTDTHGRVSLVGKGVRQAHSKRRPLLQAFQPLLIDWVGHRELKTLTQVDHVHYFKFLSGDALLSGLYLNELLYRLLPQADIHSDLFGHYEQTVAKLAENIVPLEIILRHFEKYLLQELGYGLSLTHEASTGQPIHANDHYYFAAQMGMVLHQGTLNKRCFAGDVLLKIAQEDWHGEGVLAVAKRLMRLAISDILADRELVARRLFI